MNTLSIDQKALALELFERVHGARETLAAEYPLVFDEAFDGSVVGVGEDERLHSACATLVRELVLPGRTVRAGLIGSVSTDPLHRQRGLATQVLVQAEAQLVTRGCVFGFLWADDPEFYLTRGYTPVGRELYFKLEPTSIRALPKSSGVRRMRRTDGADAAAIHALYQRHPARAARTAEETAALLGCPNMETLVLERDGAVAAYACCGRGRDLRDTIHEWGGETSLVLSLVRAHLERRFGEGMSDATGCLFLMAPASETKLDAALTAAGAERAEGILALGRILDPAAAAELLAEGLGQGARVSVEDAVRGPLFRIGGPADEGELDEEGVLALLLGTGEIRPQIEGFLERFGFPNASLPLEPFLFGLDSI